MKRLDSSVLQAKDLDVPEDILLFSVVKPPQHGRIIDPSSLKAGHKHREANPQSTLIDVTMKDLSNGTLYKTCFTERK